MFPNTGPVSTGTMSRNSHQQLVLVKKSVKCSLRSDDQMAAPVRASLALIVLVWQEGKSNLDHIITMDEFTVSMPKPETKQQSEQWLEKGVSGL